MVEKLEAYRAELEAKKATVLATNVAPIIEAKIAEYREQVIVEIQEKLDDEIAKINSDIDCINTIIEREVAAAATVETVAEGQLAMDIAQ